MKYLDAFLGRSTSREIVARPADGPDRTDKSPSLSLLTVLSAPQTENPKCATESAADPLLVRRRQLAGAWAEAYARLGSLAYPDCGRDTLGRIAPVLLRTWDEREAEAEAASLAFVADEMHRSDFEGSLSRWEAAVNEAISFLAKGCHDCGRTDATAIVTTDTGRFCRRCLHEGDRP